MPPSSPHSPSDQNHFVVDSKGRPLRLYQVWKGRNKFICGGRLIFGPDIRSMFATLSLILCPLSLFWAFVAHGLITAFPHGLGVVLVLFSAALSFYVIIIFFQTSGRDPGIIPRNRHPPDLYDDASSTFTDWASSLTTISGMPLTRNVTVNGAVVKVKYCQTCLLYRPPRCSHCSVCNNCVDRFDHHCPWVGQCIGKRNYWHFFMFVSSTTFLCLYVLACCVTYIKKLAENYNCTFWRAIGESWVSGMLIIYTFVACWFVGGLTTFHLYLIVTNQTTYENFRSQYDRKKNPYNQGPSRNVKEVFCSKVPESRNNFREMVRRDSDSDFAVSPGYSGELSVSLGTPKGAELAAVEIMENRHAVDVDECEDVRNHAASLGELQRCSTVTKYHDDDDWLDRRVSWDGYRNPEHRHSIRSASDRSESSRED